jgi:hypothetical protein
MDRWDVDDKDTCQDTEQTERSIEKQDTRNYGD